MDPHDQESTPFSAAHQLVRSGHWRTVEKAYLQQHPTCVICNSKERLNVHHQIPFSYCIPLGRPELEFEVDNLMTLCTAHDDHHLLIGHLDFFQSYNPTFLDDVEHYKNQTADKIKNDRAWRLKKRNRPPSYNHMTEEQRLELREYLDKRFPAEVAKNTRQQKRQRHH